MVTRTKKIFVGGLSAPSTVDDVKGYFEQFGRVRVPTFLLFLFFRSDVMAFVKKSSPVAKTRFFLFS